MKKNTSEWPDFKPVVPMKSRKIVRMVSGGNAIYWRCTAANDNTRPTQNN